eukprot:CAMPEP_0175079322 /NCGR_PEP_ID=MMETSP0052_2-20121109/24752_1 /TAXON_ID=51329 ORGANISM="Polytomella parva, Strain SAG 63-3" /NCGR_SAMPLE_ID=MMETSP0052_2 /ASSEMBLY_ACC=CAM_ASM_000194 /LENGTH=480 /DNA_ID=CAMNT_0016349627 /DNA_START=35 /DNA_END=1477 /DNA_ORIENTATION=+
MIKLLRRPFNVIYPTCNVYAHNFQRPAPLLKTYATIDDLSSLNSGDFVFEHEQVQGDKSPTFNELGRKKRILSGVQPTGKPTLGNYLGALKNWVDLQDNYENFFCVMDLHAITANYDPKELRQATRDMAALYLASGIDPKKSTVFVQSHVPAHTYLCWLLACQTPVNWLIRQAQFVDKSNRISASGGGEARTGLLTYPVLMAADILLYQTDLVPVGDDQRQHLQVAKELAFRFNRDFALRMKEREKEERARFKAEKRLQQQQQQQQQQQVQSQSQQQQEPAIAERHVLDKGGKEDFSIPLSTLTILPKRSPIEPLFRMPEIFTPPAGARVMSLQDGRSKMSKSHPNDGSRINLTDSADVIQQKIRRCKTDSVKGLVWGDPERPECDNLLTIYQLCAGKTKEEVADQCRDMSWGPFKELLAEAVIEHLRPIQGKYMDLQREPEYLDDLLANGAETAAVVADRTVERVRSAMGFLPAKRERK